MKRALVSQTTGGGPATQLLLVIRPHGCLLPMV
jgi:hypothetical protein